MNWRISLVSLFAAISFSGQVLAAEVNVYSEQNEQLIKPVLDAFTKETGIKVNITSGEAGQLITRLEQEKELSPADVLMAADVGNLYNAASKNLLRPVDSKILADAIPANLRDDQNRWFGVTVRSRVIVYNKAKVKPESLSTYEDLADPKWKGRVLVRSSTNIYNQSLLASLIAAHGEEKAESWAKAVVANMARTPEGNDRDQIKAVALGIGDVALANTYYVGMLTNSADATERDLVSKVGVFFPNQNDRGAHVNVRGAGVTASAKNSAEAVKFLEFLAGDTAQKIFADLNNEYPVKPGVAPSKLLESWGPFKQDTLALSEVGKNNAKAVALFDRAGWR